MRKIGIVCAGLGAVIALILGLLQKTTWFALEQVRAMSETEEFVVSFFWAAVALAVFGLILIVRSTYVADSEATFEDYLPETEQAEEELIWVCPRCGQENPDEATFCINCGWEDGTTLDVPYEDEQNWQCPSCGCVWNDSASVCTNCGYQRFG